jgi:hypothetical protein
MEENRWMIHKKKTTGRGWKKIRKHELEHVDVFTIVKSCVVTIKNELHFNNIINDILINHYN